MYYHLSLLIFISCVNWYFDKEADEETRFIYSCICSIVSLVNGASQIDQDNFHTCMVDNLLWCWGHNDGQLWPWTYRFKYTKYIHRDLNRNLRIYVYAKRKNPIIDMITNKEVACIIKRMKAVIKDCPNPKPRMEIELSSKWILLSCFVILTLLSE